MPHVPGVEMGTMIVLAGSPSSHGRASSATVLDVALVHPPQACLVLAFLVLERHRRVPRTEIADLLWDEHRPPSWDAALRGLTGRIRKFLGAQGLPPAALLAERGFYELRLPPGTEVDLEHADLSLDLAGRALENGNPRSALGHARRAQATFAAPLLPGLEHVWLQSRRERNRDGLAGSLELASAARTALGQHAGAIAAAGEAHRLVPLRESALRALMVASSAAGNRADALEAYHRGRQRLRRVLGVEPSAATQECFLGILREDAEAAPPAPGPAATVPGTRGPTTVVAAAEAELRALRRQLASDRNAPPSRELARDLIRLCLLARRFGTAVEAETACARAVVIARQLGDPGLLAEAALANATFDRIGPPARVTGLELVREALAGLDGTLDDPAGTCRAALLCRQVQYLAGAHQGAAATLVATELADSVADGSPVGLRAWSLAARLQAGGAAGCGTPRDLRAAGGLELFELARGTDAELALLGLEQRAAAIAESGDLDGAYAVMAAYARLAESEGTPWGLFRVVVHGCFRAAAEGRFDDCERLAGELGRLGAQLGPPWVIAAFQAAAVYVPRWLTGRAAELLAPFRDLTQHLDGVQTDAPLAFLAAQTAEPAMARAALTQALASWREGGADACRVWGLTMFNLAGAAVRLGDQDAAARLYADLLPVADDTCVYDGLIYLGSYQVHLGRLALACGWWETAAAHLQTALDRHRRARATPWVALAAEALADALEEGGARPPTARTAALREEARELASRVGMRLPGSVAARGGAMQACG